MSALDEAVTSEPPSERPRLKLAPRSAAAASSGPAKSSIFGGARTREEILAAKGVTEDDLLDFVRVHSTDLDYMRDVWNEVELRMDRSPEVAEER